MEKKSEEGVMTEFIGPKFVASKRPQYIAGLVATIGAFGTGTMLGWSSPGFPSMQEDGKFGVLTKDDESWVGSTAMLGSLTAGLLAGFFIDVVGRKLTMIGMAAILLGGWILLALSSSLGMVIAARFITGIAGGMCLAVPVYISEIAQSEIRGLLGNSMVLVLVFGILFVYIIGSVVNYAITSWICMVIPAIFIPSIWFMPESPRYLLLKGRKTEAANSLKWLRGAPSVKDIEPELEEMEASVKESIAQAGSLMDLFKPSVAKPVGIAMMGMFLQQYGGINVVQFYSVTIFESAGSSMDSNVSSILIAGVQVLFCGVSCLLVDRLGRKILMVVSGAGMSLSIIVLGVYFYLKYDNGNVSPEGLGWLPLASLILYIVFYNLGLGPLPWLLMSELVPSYVKGSASAICTAFCWLLGFIVTKTFTDMENAIETHGCYWLFGGVCAAGALFSLFVIPETKGKSLDEIQKLFE